MSENTGTEDQPADPRDAALAALQRHLRGRGVSELVSEDTDQPDPTPAGRGLNAHRDGFAKEAAADGLRRYRGGN